MTCVAGIAENGKVWIGADSAGTDAWWNQTIRADAKVFKVGPFIMGFTSSFRMGQILRYSLDVPKQTTKQADDEFMCTSFIDSVRKSLKDGGFSHIRDNVEKGGNFLVGYRGQLWEVESDYQVGVPVSQYAAVGSGGDFATAVLDVYTGTPRKRILKALEVAAYRSAGVAAPFVVLSGGEAK